MWCTANGAPSRSPEAGDCPNFRGHRPGTDAKRWSAMVNENGTVPLDAAKGGNSVPLLGTSSARCNLAPLHCLFQAVAHCGEKCDLADPFHADR